MSLWIHSRRQASRKMVSVRVCGWGLKMDGKGFQEKAYGLEALRASFDFSGVVSFTVTVDEVSYAVAIFTAIVLHRGVYQLLRIAYVY